MEVSDNEGLANYVVPESCAACRERCGEASTGVRAGQPLSRDSLYIPSADAVDTTEGNTTGRDIASTPSAWHGRRPWHARSLHRNQDAKSERSESVRFYVQAEWVFGAQSHAEVEQRSILLINAPTPGSTAARHLVSEALRRTTKPTT